jgi:hypothetical protein
MRTLRSIAVGLAAILLFVSGAPGAAGVATFKKNRGDPGGMNAKDFFVRLDGSLGGNFGSLILVFGGCFTSDFTNRAKDSAVGKSGKPVAVLAATDVNKETTRAGGLQTGGSFVQGVSAGFNPGLTESEQPGTVKQAFDGGKARVERDERTFTEAGREPPAKGQKPTFTALGEGADAVQLGRGATSYHAILFVGLPKTVADWNDLRTMYDTLVDSGYDPNNIKTLFGSGRARDGSPALLGDDDQPSSSVLERARGTPQEYIAERIRIEAATHENLGGALDALAAIARGSKTEQYFIWTADHSTMYAMADPAPRLQPGQALASANVNLGRDFVAIAREPGAGRPEVVIEASGVTRRDLTVSLNGSPVGALDPGHEGVPQGVPCDASALRPGDNLVTVATGGTPLKIAEVGISTGPIAIQWGQPPVVAQSPAAPRPTGPVSATLIGVVLPDDARAGETVSGIVVTNPRDWEGASGVRVVSLTVPLERDKSGKPLLDGITVRAGGADHPAGDGFTCTVPTDGSDLTIVIGREGLTAPLAQTKVPFKSGAPAAGVPPSGFQTSPVCQAGTVHRIDGSANGVSADTLVSLNGEKLKIVAETPRAVYCLVPDGAKAGLARLELTEKDTKASFPVATLRLEMSADKLDLIRGESTRFSAVIAGLEALPESLWRGGSSLDPVALARARSRVPGLTIPTGGEPGTLFLVVENRSPGVITIDGEREGAITRTFAYADRLGGKYRLDGTIRSKRSGGFNVHGEVFPFLAPVAAQTAAAP